MTKRETQAQRDPESGSNISGPSLDRRAFLRSSATALAVSAAGGTRAAGRARPLGERGGNSKA